MAQIRRASTKVQVRKRQDRFLLAFSKTGTIMRAAIASKITKQCVSLWRRNDPAFEKRFQDLELEVTSLLEESAVDSALGRWDAKEKRYVGGDSILKIFLLKSRKPLIYRDQFKVEHAGEIKTTPGPDLSQMTKEQLLELAGMKP